MIKIVMLILRLSEFFYSGPVSVHMKWVILIFGNLPREGVLFMLQQIFTLIVAPTIVGIVTKLFFRWLDGKDDK